MNMFLINLEDYSNCIFVSSYIVSQSPWPILPRWTGPWSMCLYRKNKRDNAVASVSASHCERWKLCFSTEKLPITLPSKCGIHFKSYKLRGNLSLKGFIEEQLNTFPECCTSCETQYCNPKQQLSSDPNQTTETKLCRESVKRGGSRMLYHIIDSKF